MEVRIAQASAGPTARALVMTGVAGLGLAAFVNLRPQQPWILWLTAALVALGVDGLVRTHPKWRSEGWFTSVVYVVLPALATLGIGYFIDEVVNGYWRLAAAAAGTLAVGIVAYGQYHTVDFGSRLYGAMRLLLAMATYLTAFALYAVMFNSDIGLPLAGLAVAAVSMALSVEMLRESHLTGPSSLLVGLAIGVSLGELRLVLYFFALDGLFAGALLINAFYLATGLVHHLLDRDLGWGTAAEYIGVATVGTAAVLFTRVLL